MKPTEMNGHTGDGSIGTPDDLFRWLDRRFSFNYDAFASHENALCDTYSTIEGTFDRSCLGVREIDGDGRVAVAGLDGLAFPWIMRVFMNPPYGSEEEPCELGCEKKRCIKRGEHTTSHVTGYTECILKAISERNNADIIVGLMKYDASTENGRLLRENFHLEYLPRIKYKGMAAPAPFASVIAIAIPDRYRA